MAKTSSRKSALPKLTRGARTGRLVVSKARVEAAARRWVPSALSIPLGPATREAIRKFQLAAGEAETETGEPSEMLFESIKKKCAP